MKTISSLLIFILSTSICLCQETFPINGVENNYKSPIAFINAKIHQSSSKVIENGMMLVQDDKILSVGDSITIPKNAIVKDLNGDFIYPSFIELISDLAFKLQQKLNSVIPLNTKVKKLVHIIGIKV